MNDGTLNSTAASSTINITPVNDAPVVNAHGGSLAYTENQAATAIDTALTGERCRQCDAGRSDGIDHQQPRFCSRTCSGFTNQNGITGSYNSCDRCPDVERDVERGELSGRAGLGDVF